MRGFAIRDYQKIKTPKKLTTILGVFLNITSISD
jgi:hypothetical protein